MSKARRYTIYGWIVCLLAAIFYCYEFLLRIEPSVMVPELKHNFHVDIAGLGLLSSMYYYAYTPLQAIVGLVIDRFGPRRVLTFAIGFCALGSWVFAAASDVYLAGIGRLMIGVGSAFAFVGVLKLASMWLPYSRFALFAGITTALGMFGAMIGDISLSWAVGHIGWHRVVIGSAFFGLLLIPIFILFVHERKMEAQEALSWHQTLRGFIKVVRNRQVLLAGAIGCLLYTSLSIFAVMWGLDYLVEETGITRVQAGEINSMVFLGWLIGAPLNGWLTDLIQSRRKLLIVGGVLAGLLFIPLLYWPHMPHLFLFPLLVVFGLCSSVQVLCFAIARDVTGVNRVASAIAVVNLLVMLGGMILQPGTGLLIHELHASLQNVSLAMVYRYALLVVPLCMFVGSFLACYLPETYRQQGQVCE